MSFFSEFRLWFNNHLISSIPSHYVRNLWYKYLMNFTIGKNSSIHLSVTFDCAGGFYLGDSSTINSGCRIDNRGSIKIGSNVCISEKVTILTADHDLQSLTFDGRIRKVEISDFVFIGTRALLLPGITLAEGSAVAAGSVVTKSVEPFVIVAGVPAKPIGIRPRSLNYNVSYRRLFK